MPRIKYLLFHALQIKYWNISLTGEEKFLHQLAIEEQFGITMEEKESQKEKHEKKGHGASIGYNYDDPTQTTNTSNVLT